MLHNLCRLINNYYTYGLMLTHGIHGCYMKPPSLGPADMAGMIGHLRCSTCCLGYLHIRKYKVHAW